MTRYTGGLIPGIETYLQGKTNRKFGLLIIDEQDSGNSLSQRTIDQQRIIAFAQEMKFKSVMIELNPAMTTAGRHPTNNNLVKMLPKDTPVFFKIGMNAFGIIDASGKSFGNNRGKSLLDTLLRSAGINELIVMGQMGEMCVNRTVVGGYDNQMNQGPRIDGAIDLGYQVWICPQIINSDKKAWLGWYDDFGVKCYTAVS